MWVGGGSASTLGGTCSAFVVEQEQGELVGGIGREIVDRSVRRATRRTTGVEDLPGISTLVVSRPDQHIRASTNLPTLELTKSLEAGADEIVRPDVEFVKSMDERDAAPLRPSVDGRSVKERTPIAL